MRHVILILGILLVLVGILIPFEGGEGDTIIYIILLILIGFCLILGIIRIRIFSKSDKKYKIIERCELDGRIEYNVQEETLFSWHTWTGHLTVPKAYHSKEEALEGIAIAKKYDTHKPRVVYEEE